MDIQQYKAAFLKDAREHLALLALAIPSIGKDNGALVNAHRAFHSIAGTAGTMGLEEIASISREHELLLKVPIEAGSLPTQEEIEKVTAAMPQIEEELSKIEQA